MESIEHTHKSKECSKSDQFEQDADAAQAGLLQEFVDFLMQNKKWWLTPIIFTLLLIGVLVIFGGTVAAPFLYTLF